MSLCAGQASTQGAGSGQCTQREASNIASSGVIGMQTSSKSHTLCATGRWLISRLGNRARAFRSIANDSLEIFSIQHLLHIIHFHIIGEKGKVLVPIVMDFCDGCHMMIGKILAWL
jgi:hypothetical protein